MVVDPREQHLRRREDAVEAGRRWQEVFRGGGTHVLDRHPPPRRRDAVPHRLGEQRERDAAVDRHEPAARGASAPRAGTQVDRSFTRAASSAAWVAGCVWCILQGLAPRAEGVVWRVERKGEPDRGERLQQRADVLRFARRRDGHVRHRHGEPCGGGGMSRRMPSKAASPWQGERGRVHPRGRPARGSPVIKQRRDGREGPS